VAHQVNGGPNAAGGRGRERGGLAGQPPDPAAVGPPRHQTVEVSGQQGHAEEEGNDPGAEDGGDDRDRERVLAREHPEVQAETSDHQRPHEDRVQDGHERDHAASDDARLEPRSPQRPGRQRDAAGARGGERRVAATPAG
jgi:hypothetical protein